MMQQGKGTWLVAGLFAGLLAAGCTSSARFAGTGAVPVTTAAAALAGRPFAVHVPSGYLPTIPAPLLIVLHGYTASGVTEERYLRLTSSADAHGMLSVYPDGTIDRAGNHFWNATDACCNRFGSTVDDSAYLSALIARVEATYAVDTRRVYFVGHSNGGFMAYRMACDHAGQVAAVVSLEGASFLDPASCRPSQAVAILEVHGTADATIRYNGGTFISNPYPSAETTVATWARYDGCSPTPDKPGPAPHPIEQGLPPATVRSYSAGCALGGHAELWTQSGGGHAPAWTPTFDEQIVAFLLDHPKP